MNRLFETAIESATTWLAGPWRAPRQMLAPQSYDNHASIHDDATARQLGFKGGTIEGPRHFSQFVPLCLQLFGTLVRARLLVGLLCNVCYEGDQVRAFLARPERSAQQVALWMQRTDGTEVLRGSASIGSNHPATALEQRLSELTPLERPIILRDVRVACAVSASRCAWIRGNTWASSIHLRWPTSSKYCADGAASSPWRRAIIIVLQYVPRSSAR